MNKPKVYLCGGFRSGWDDEAADQLGHVYDTIQPKLTGLKDQEEYTPMDLGLIEQSSVLLANMEPRNPGRNLYFEIGYAKRAGKLIVMVIPEDYFFLDGIPQRYMGMLMESADFITNSMEDAVRYLKAYADGTMTDEFDLPVWQDHDDDGLYNRVEATKQDLPLVEGWSIDMAEEGADEFLEVMAGAASSENAGGTGCTMKSALTIALVMLEAMGVSLCEEAIASAYTQAKNADDLDDRSGTAKVVCIRRMS